MAPRSHFLELPVDLRQQIYSYLFAWPDFPAHSTEGRKAQDGYEAQARSLKLICGVCRLDFHKYRDRFVDREIDTRADYHLKLFRYQHDTPRDPTPILRTCRQVYFEAIDCLYNKTLFVFAGRYSASRWQAKQDPWRLIGTTTDEDKGIGGGSAFLKRVTNIHIRYAIQSGRDGQAVKTFLLLLNDLLIALRPDRRFTEIELRFRVWTRWSEEPNTPGRTLKAFHDKSWEAIRQTAGEVQFGCIPSVSIARERGVDEAVYEKMEGRLLEVFEGKRVGGTPVAPITIACHISLQCNGDFLR